MYWLISIIVPINFYPQRWGEGNWK